MYYSPFDLRGMAFVPLSEAKAKLSEFMRRIASGRERLAVTTNGRPTAVILSYRDYLFLLGQSPRLEPTGEGEVLSLEEWRKGSRERKRISASIRDLFNYDSLSRKGRKRYKKDLLREFGR